MKLATKELEGVTFSLFAVSEQIEKGGTFVEVRYPVAELRENSNHYDELAYPTRAFDEAATMHYGVALTFDRATRIKQDGAEMVELWRMQQVL